MPNRTTAILGGVAWLALLAAAVGWVLNIIALTHSSFDPVTGMVVLRAFGVVIAPLGAVLGYL